MSVLGEADIRRLLSASLSDEIEVHDKNDKDGQYVVETSEDTAFDATDIFDDCVSNFSEDHPHKLVDRLRDHFTNRMSPDDFFDTPLTFFGE